MERNKHQDQPRAAGSVESPESSSRGLIVCPTDSVEPTPQESTQNEGPQQASTEQDHAEIELIELGLVDPEQDDCPEVDCPEVDCPESESWPGTLLEESAPQETARRNEPAPEMECALGAATSTSQLLERIQVQLAELSQTVASHAAAQSNATIQPTNVHHSPAHADEELLDRVAELEQQVSELEQQNSDLAAKVATSNVRETVSGTVGDSMLWEERKALILQQMEDDSFDADDDLLNEPPGGDQAGLASDAEAPVELVEQLTSELQQRDREIARREEELQELRAVLEQQSETLESGVSVGAAGIAQLLDSDDLIRDEKERLQMLQIEWEEKFRQGEIEASLERAKLSRERQEVARKQAELEEELIHMRRESKHSKKSEEMGTSRRWLAQLGLTDKS